LVSARSDVNERAREFPALARTSRFYRSDPRENETERDDQTSYANSIIQSFRFLISALSIAGVTICALLLAPTPAPATDARQAMKMCDKNPNCDYRINGADGGMDLYVTGANGTTTTVACPQRGQCSCVDCGGRQSGTKAAGGVLNGNKVPTQVLGAGPR
jgi:hypothetical protein